ncbi:PAP2-domain-containing protein [Lophium mytilinum]|uniref:PAP2-domain-containing protein n=1 Tax=Lophium mytilinum TaxID=390894 RepID=A0A6A6QZW8_9PEZI|nr:PAP2-domain-containing protein [Lophium mytilinum]
MSDSTLATVNNRADVEAGKPESGFFPDWPGFRHFFRNSPLHAAIEMWTVWLVGAVSLYLFLQPPAFLRPPLFQVYPDGTVPGDITVPYTPEIISTIASAGIATGVPLLVIVLVEFTWIRSFRSLMAAIRGLQMALLYTTFATVVIKTTFGSLRPHFVDVCAPLPPLSGTGFDKDWYNATVCTGNDASRIRDAQQSFPSGHASSAFAAATYLILWLNAVLKVYGPYQTPEWKFLALLGPLLGATLIALSKVADSYHHASDVVAGAAIGTIIALVAYRGAHASIFDWRYNHMPLSPSKPFDYETDYVDVRDLRFGTSA